MISLWNVVSAHYDAELKGLNIYALLDGADPAACITDTTPPGNAPPTQLVASPGSIDIQRSKYQNVVDSPAPSLAHSM